MKNPKEMKEVLLNVGLSEKLFLNLNKLSRLKERMNRKPLLNRWKQTMIVNWKIIDFIWKACLKNQFPASSSFLKPTAKSSTMKIISFRLPNKLPMDLLWPKEFHKSGKLWQKRIDSHISRCHLRRGKPIDKVWRHSKTRTKLFLTVLRRLKESKPMKPEESRFKEIH